MSVDNFDENNLVLYKVDQHDKNADNILEYEVESSFSIYPNIPLLKYGFYYYIHQTKDKMSLFEKPEYKSKELHKIVNPFEDNVPQENFIKQFKNDKLLITDDIHSYSIKYFKSDRIISRAFYKLWELLIMFPLIKDKSKNITTIHIAEAPGSFAQSVIYYREKFFTADQIKNDQYIATSIEVKKPGEYIPVFNTNLNVHKQFKQWSYKDSDLTNTDIIDQFILQNSKSKAHLITADGGFNWKNENYQEQEAYVLLLSEIYCALKTQEIDGNFVIKFFETFTELTVKMIEILKKFYKTVYITKPLLSRPSNSERYIVCLNFHNTNNKFVDKIYQIIKNANKNQEKYLVDIFPDYNIKDDLDIIIKLSSTDISNEQHKQINNMITYINEGNYFGDIYRKYLLNRRRANDFWISLFYPLSLIDLIAVRKLINNLIDKKLITVNQKLKEFSQKLNY